MRLSAALVLSAARGEAITLEVCDLALGALAEGAVFDDGWLTEGVAWRALFSFDQSEDLVALRTKLRELLSGATIDVNLLPDDLAFTKKRLLVADMESTLIEQEMIDEVAREAGVWEHVSRITAATMRGELPFEASLCERVRSFEGLALERLQSLAPRMTLMPGAEHLFQALKQQGVVTAIVTGGFSVFAELIGARLGADHVIGNRLEIVDGHLTGRLIEPVIGVAGKRDALAGLASTHGIDLMCAAAVGDGANDLGMLEAAGLGVAYRAKPKVREAQRALPTGAVIDHCDLSALLDLMGLSRGGGSR